ncbi:MAG: peptidyl-prolyl cis-trans isomerase B [Lysobacterales bacterium]|jgi:cyclophilin family peptidyl-prolyl cis-trans isomerase|nr:MAG: peptidyl-prolyl cis-trans isomerase B [Xanthomonadales bacterium]
MRSSLVATVLLSAGLSAQAESLEPKVVLVTNLGEIVLELDPHRAPKTVENFLTYVREGHYDGTIFHRVIDGFVIQGGGLTPDYREKPTRAPIPNEANNGLSNRRGTIAMARTREPHSARAQFFINVVDNPRLDFVSDQSGHTWGYAVFGKVIKGMDVVDQIRKIPTGPGGPFASDVPQTPVIIERAYELTVESAEPAAAPEEAAAPTETPPAAEAEREGGNGG